MAELVDNPFTVEQCRRFYAEEIRVVADLGSSTLVEAFARVPRELFLGPPPWQFSSGGSLRCAAYRMTSQIRDLYHDVFVALKGERLLNNGQPSMIARLLAALDLGAGKRVLHIGCGTGYYTAIMAEAVGHQGAVTAVEVDPELAAMAEANLSPYANVKVLNQDGTSLEPVSSDAILINAGVTDLPAAWLNGLSETGVLVAPLLVGRTPASNDAMAVRFGRRGQRFTAELVTVLTIFPCTGLRNPAMQALLNKAFESHTLLRVNLLRREEHAQNSDCIVHVPGFCLSAEAADAR